MISKTVQSLKTIIESNLDLERSQAKLLHGGHLENKMAVAQNLFLNECKKNLGAYLESSWHN